MIIFVSFLIALPELEELEYKKTVYDMIQPKPIPLIEERPDVAAIVELFLLGKPMEERDKERDKERILYSFFELKLKAEVIAKAFKTDLEFVKEVIKEAKKQGYKPNQEGSGDHQSD